MKRLWNYLKKLNIPLINEDGFTLIEAIATIAIVGIVVTPIAMVFQGSLLNSLEARKQMKANQVGQEYVEILEEMDFNELKRLVDDFGGVVSSDSITNGGFDLPKPDDDFDVLVDLHYGPTRTDSSVDNEYNSVFDTDYFAMPSNLSNAPMPTYNMVLHLNSAAENGFDFYESDDAFLGVDPPEGSYATTTGNRDITIKYAYTSPDKATIRVSVTQNSITHDYDYTNGTEDNRIIIYCDDLITSEENRIESYISIESYIEEEVNLLVFESVNDKIKPELNIGLGVVNVTRGLSVVDVSSNTHRIYEIEVTISKSGSTEPLLHVVTTRLAK